MFNAFFGSFSTSVHHYAQETNTAKKREFVATDLLTLRLIKAPPDDDDTVWLIPNQEQQVYEEDEMVVHHARLASQIEARIRDLPTNQKARAVLAKVEMLYVHNPTQVTLDFVVQDSDAADWLGESAFPVECSLCLPHSMACEVDADKRTRYVPAFNELGFDVLSFAAMEERILDLRPDQDGVIVFKKQDILGRFIHREKDALGAEPGEVQVQDDFFVVRASLLERTQTLFREKIFPMIQYTGGENILCTWNLGVKEQTRLYKQYQDVLDRYDPAQVPTISVLVKTTYNIVTEGAKPVVWSKEKKIHV